MNTPSSWWNRPCLIIGIVHVVREMWWSSDRLSCWSSDRCWSSGRCHVWRDGVVDAMHQPASDAMSLTVFNDWIDHCKLSSMDMLINQCMTIVIVIVTCERHRIVIGIVIANAIALSFVMALALHVIGIAIVTIIALTLGLHTTITLWLHMIVHLDCIWSCIWNMIVHCHRALSLHCHVIVNAIALSLVVSLALDWHCNCDHQCIDVGIAYQIGVAIVHRHCIAIVIVIVIALPCICHRHCERHCIVIRIAISIVIHIAISIALSLCHCDHHWHWHVIVDCHGHCERRCIVNCIAIALSFALNCDHHCITHWNLVIVLHILELHVRVSCIAIALLLSSCTNIALSLQSHRYCRRQCICHSCVAPSVLQMYHNHCMDHSLPDDDCNMQSMQCHRYDAFVYLLAATIIDQHVRCIAIGDDVDLWSHISIWHCHWCWHGIVIGHGTNRLTSCPRTVAMTLEWQAPCLLQSMVASSHASRCVTWQSMAINCHNQQSHRWSHGGGYIVCNHWRDESNHIRDDVRSDITVWRSRLITTRSLVSDRP